MKESKDTCIEVIIGIDDDDLSKLKDEHINEIELDYDKYIKNIRDLENSSEELVSKAEEFLQGPQVDYTTQPVSAAAGTVAEMFKPQSNLNPSFLDKMASHLEVHKFVQRAEVYIQTGFRETPPQGIWAYLRPLVHVTWSDALEQGGVKDKDLKGTLDMLVEESQLRNPVRGRRIDFLATKRGGQIHSNFFRYCNRETSSD